MMTDRHCPTLVQRHKLMIGHCKDEKLCAKESIVSFVLDIPSRDKLGAFGVCEGIVSRVARCIEVAHKSEQKQTNKKGSRCISVGMDGRVVDPEVGSDLFHTRNETVLVTSSKES
jgi:hypothetical protein